MGSKLWGQWACEKLYPFVEKFLLSAPFVVTLVALSVFTNWFLTILWLVRVVVRGLCFISTTTILWSLSLSALTLAFLMWGEWLTLESTLVWGQVRRIFCLFSCLSIHGGYESYSSWVHNTISVDNIQIAKRTHWCHQFTFQSSTSIVASY